MRHRLTVGVASVVLLAGCTSGDGGAPGPGEGLEGEPAPSSSSSQSHADDLGPLARALGYEEWDPEVRDHLAQLTTEQDAIAACMREAGFSYWPHVPTIDGITVGEGPAPGSREFAMEHGYGVWRPADRGISVTYPDPPPEQEAYLATLSPAALEEYVVALEGEVEEVFEDGGYVTSGGCSAEGNAATAPTPVQDPAMLEARDFVASVATRAEFDALYLEWSRCLGDAGLDYAYPWEPEMALWDRREAVLAEEADPDTGWPAADVVIAESEQEVATALADYECRESLDYDTRFRAIRDEIEQDYLDDHPELLATLE